MPFVVRTVLEHTGGPVNDDDKAIIYTTAGNYHIRAAYDSRPRACPCLDPDHWPEQVQTAAEHLLDRVRRSGWSGVRPIQVIAWINPAAVEGGQVHVTLTWGHSGTHHASLTLPGTITGFRPEG